MVAYRLDYILESKTVYKNYIKIVTTASMAILLTNRKKQMSYITFSTHSFLSTAPWHAPIACSIQCEKAILVQQSRKVVHGHWKSVVQIKVVFGVRTGRNCY